jgi:hypothetical protein
VRDGQGLASAWLPSLGFYSALLRDAFSRVRFPTGRPARLASIVSTSPMRASKVDQPKARALRTRMKPSMISSRSVSTKSVSAVSWPCRSRDRRTAVSAVASHKRSERGARRAARSRRGAWRHRLAPQRAAKPSALHVARHHGQVVTTKPVKSTAWPFTVVLAEHVSPVTLMMFADAGSHRHPSGPASRFVLQHTGGPASWAACLGVAAGAEQPTASRMRRAKRKPHEERIAEDHTTPRRRPSCGITMTGYTKRAGNSTRQGTTATVSNDGTTALCHLELDAITLSAARIQDTSRGGRAELDGAGPARPRARRWLGDCSSAHLGPGDIFDRRRVTRNLSGYPGVR